MRTWIAEHKVAVGGGGLVALAGLAWLAFGWFGVHTLFVDREVQEDGPVFASGAVAAPSDTADAAPSTDAGPETGGEASGGEDDAGAPEPDAGGTRGDQAATTATTAPIVETLVEGSFISRGRYSSEGRAFVLSDGIESFLRFEGFATDNGPDLFVYLVADTTQDGPESTFDADFVNLGALRGNIGDQNYEIPADVDVERYRTVVIWCRRFSSAFGAADLR